MDFSKLIQPDNPVFAGGLGLALMALGAQGLRAGMAVAKLMIRRHLLTTLEITSKDRAYPWVLQWLSTCNRKNQHISVETSLKPIQNKQGIQASSVFDFVPGPGQHFIWYNGLLINVQRYREQQMVDLNTGKPWEKIVFTSITRNTKLFEQIMYESLLLASTKEEGKTVIFTNWGSEWRQFGNPRTRRPLDSVILDEGVSEGIVSDVLEWKASHDWYMNRGIPYRRGYLMYGPPGSGKSSFIMALAGHLNYNICILNMAERGMSDDRLAHALSCAPQQSLILLEDIDAAFPSRTDHHHLNPSTTATAPSSGLGVGMHTQHMQSDITFSGLLNVLDGVASSEERLLFLTTNHPGRLDPALTRPGRVDVVQLIGDASEYQIKKMFNKFYMRSYSYSSSTSPSLTSDTTHTTPSVSTGAGVGVGSFGTTTTASEAGTEVEVSPYLLELQQEFVDKIKASGLSLSMARLQGHLMRHKQAPADAVTHTHELFEGIKTPSSSSPSSSAPTATVNIHNSKTSPVTADSGSSSSSDTHTHTSSSSNHTSPVKSRGRRVLSVAEVDRMPFNPQPGWDRDLKDISSL